MTTIECPFPGCTYKTQEVSEIIAVALLNAHAHAHSNPVSTTPPATGQRIKGPKLQRPHIQTGVTTETWNAFVRRWETFCTGSDIDDAFATRQLFYCADEELGDIILRAETNFTTMPITQALGIMKSFAVVPIARGVLRSEFSSMHQSADEPFRNFAAKVRGKAETCDFKIRCGTCSSDIYYTDESIRDVLLNGIADSDIRRDALSILDIQTKTIGEVIAFIESKETARNANPLPALNSISSYRRVPKQATQQSNQAASPRRSLMNEAKGTPPNAADRAKTTRCPNCGKSFHIFSEMRRGWNKTPHQHCIDCWRAKRSGPQASHNTVANAITAEQAYFVGQIAGIERYNSKYHKQCPNKNSESITMTHQVFSKGEWRKAQFAEHPRIRINVTKDSVNSCYGDVYAIADSGAQSNLWSLNDFLSSGFSMDDLTPVTLTLHAANKSSIPIEGAFLARIQATKRGGSIITCKAMIYVSSGVKGFYMSYDTMLDLGVLNQEFPAAGSAWNQSDVSSDVPNVSMNLLRALDVGCITPRTNNTSCECPQRECVPKRPERLPFPCIPENIERMKTWLLQYYEASTFNTCPHRPLPCMAGPPVEIHLDASAQPRACHTAASIPVHWQEKVHEDLIRDEALGVIERVPYGEPVIWCHRMVVTRKHDGNPRRTVDLSPLNKFCRRETHSSESPFNLARRIPKQTWKTVTDAWNGYHSVPLRQSDRHLTTFITPFGRWRYARAPQGFLSSGDGYNRRFDAILADFQRRERIVDDNIHYDSELEEHWWRTIDLLSTVGAAGVILNPDKFQFSQRTVDFAGFRISDDRIDPLPKYFAAIRDFPTPKSTTDIRSWFGLVNQVTNYAQLRDIMSPFRPFLSPKVQFTWTSELDHAFESSKQEIIKAIRHGVEIFDTKKLTCLRPDWSNKGVGYFLLQQHCTCPINLPDCCPDGWKITLAGSRFLTSAEQRYAPIEGEALAVAWGLEQTKFFTQGCEKLLVVTDHKPLVKIFGDRTLDEISNTRLFRLKQRALPWYFTIAHLPGKSNMAADATSRHPSPLGEIDSLNITDLVEPAYAASIRRDSEAFMAISWQRLAQETDNDKNMRALRDTVCDGFPENHRHLSHAAPYWRYRDSLYTSDGVVLYEDRVVVPPSLRPHILNGLHAAHQGVSSMELRARAIVFWPGITDDIHGIRAACIDCVKNAPSQAPLPSTPATPPLTPFEAIFADFFEYIGHHYLVIGDRLSGWTEIFGSTCGTPQSGANGLIKHLRSFFSVFGVPEELSSDGGPEFTSSITQKFLEHWGVRHRISSAYHPQSNGRAEVAVKSAKRLLRANIGPSGSLNSDGLLQAMLQLRNTPDPDCDISPAQIVFGKPLRDAFSFVNKLEKFSNPHIRPIWRNAWCEKEIALKNRFSRSAGVLNAKARPLQPLVTGDNVYIQNQTGNHSKRWDRSGIVVDVLNYDSYLVKVDGSGRLTKRNRKYLRRFVPVSTEIPEQHMKPAHRPGYPPIKDFQDAAPPSPSKLSPDSTSTDLTCSMEQVLIAPTTKHTSMTVPISTTPVSPISQTNTPHMHRAFSPTLSDDHVDTTSANTSQPRSRPRRNVKPPLRYEAETGKWI